MWPSTEGRPKVTGRLVIGQPLGQGCGQEEQLISSRWKLEWQEERLKDVVRNGTINLLPVAICAAFLLATSIVEAAIFMQDPGGGDAHGRGRKVHQEASIIFTARLVVDCLITVVCVGTLTVLWRRPDLKHYQCEILLSYGLMFFYLFPPNSLQCEMYISLLAEIPFAQKTEQHGHAAWIFRDHLRLVNCSAQGSYVSTIITLWIVQSAVILPLHSMMKLNLVFIFCAYLPANLLYYWKVSKEGMTLTGIACRVVQFCICHVFAAKRSHQLERADQKRFHYHKNESMQTQAMKTVLGDMVPEFVMVPLMQIEEGQYFAKPADCASVLFIMLEGFDNMVRSPQWPPHALLDFLNEVFASLDAICNHYGVMKIETVREEYVCAVGVDPADEVTNQKQGHKACLARMINAAVAILEGQSKEVEVKMGLYTGDIYMGVIGNKLPRFRLFGDTINMAARMMQKGIPGTLQFAQASWLHFPKPLPPRVQVREREAVEMKGKGLVDVFVLSLESDPDSAYGAELHKIASERNCAGAGEFPLGQPIRLSTSASARTTTPAINKTPTIHRCMTGLKYAVNIHGVAQSTPCGLPTDPYVTTFEDPDVQEPDTDSLGDKIVRVGGRRSMQPVEKNKTVEQVMSENEATKEKKPKTKPRRINWLDQIRFVGSLRTAFFTDEVEEEWQSWHHHHLFCDGLLSRLDQHILEIAVLSIFDMALFALRNHSSDDPEARHMIYRGEYGPTCRLPVFIICRACCCMIITFWRELVCRARRIQFEGGHCYGTDAASFPSPQSRTSMLSPAEAEEATPLGIQRVAVQMGTLVSYIMITFLFYISYDAITVSSWNWVRVAELKAARQSDFQRTSNILVETLKEFMLSNTENLAALKHFSTQTYIVVIFCAATSHPWPFRLAAWLHVSVLSLLIIVFIISMVCESLEVRCGILTLSGPETILVVLCGVVNLLYMSYFSEKSSRASFKAMKRFGREQTRLGKILTRLAPPEIIAEMWEKPPGAALPSHMYKVATVAQSDLTGFTKLASTRQPQQVVILVTDLFGRFDELSDLRGIWKVETVGDAYIAACAEFPLTEEKHALSLVVFGQDMIRAVHQWARDHKLLDVTVRVGVHHGECIGGMVGTTCQRYHLFGDLMTIVDTIESTSLPSKVHVSKRCRERVVWELEIDEPLDGEMDLCDFFERTEPTLETSKNEKVTYQDVGGRTYFADFSDSHLIPAYPRVKRDAG